MTATAATPSLLRRWPITTVVIAVLALALAAVAVGEAMGWPVLAGPLQRLMADKLERRVSFSATATGAGSATAQEQEQAQTQMKTQQEASKITLANKT